MSSLFTSLGDADSLYERLKRRAREYGCDACERVDDLWVEYSEFADSNFQEQFRSSVHERYWEMYLACTLKQRGFVISCPKPGPDIGLLGPERTVWIEAVAAGQGSRDNPDRVPDVEYDTVVGHPETQILLRYRNSIETKHQVHMRWLEKDVVARDDPYVIAVSGGALESHFDMDEAPDILKAVLPVGFEQIRIAIPSGECLGVDFAFRPHVTRISGSHVSTSIFLDSAYENISAVLYSGSNLLNPPPTAGSEFVVVHNPLARNPLPAGWLGFGAEFRPELSESSLSIPRTSYEKEPLG